MLCGDVETTAHLHRSIYRYPSSPSPCSHRCSSVSNNGWLNFLPKSIVVDITCPMQGGCSDRDGSENIYFALAAHRSCLLNPHDRHHRIESLNSSHDLSHAVLALNHHTMTSSHKQISTSHAGLQAWIVSLQATTSTEMSRRCTLTPQTGTRSGRYGSARFRARLN